MQDKFHVKLIFPWEVPMRGPVICIGESNVSEKSKMPKRNMQSNKSVWVVSHAMFAVPTIMGERLS